MSHGLVWPTIVPGCDVDGLPFLPRGFVGGCFKYHALLFVLTGLSARKQLIHTLLFLVCQVGYAGNRGSEWLSHKGVVLQKIFGKYNGHEEMLHVQLRKLVQTGWR